jgi:hypothetical protein
VALGKPTWSYMVMLFAGIPIAASVLLSVMGEEP